MFLRFDGEAQGLNTLQNQALDLKTFRDRILWVFELFWSPFWLLKSIKTKQKINQIFETILDAIQNDGWDPERCERTGQAECARLLEA